MCDLTSIGYLTIREVSEQLHLSRSTVYELIAREGLPVVHFGRAVRVSKVSLEQWLARREAAQARIDSHGSLWHTAPLPIRQKSKARPSLRQVAPRGQASVSSRR